jgi:ribosome biogenesis protein MAK21
MHLLQELSSKHPNMQIVIVKEIQQFMCRPNVSEAAQYYSILFLNQIFFRREQDAELAKHVVIFYFEIFKRYIREAFDPNEEDRKKKKDRKRLEKSDEKLSKKKRKELERLKQEEKIATQNRT